VNKLISILIPTYEAKGKGSEFLEYSFERIEIQTFKDYDIIITDDSEDNEINLLCNKWKNKLDIKYYKNPNQKGTASNLNNGLSKVTNKWIKLMDFDDYFIDKYALDRIINKLDNTYNWLVSSYLHTKDKINYFRYHIPSINQLLCLINTIGTCSGITLKNVDNMPLFDINLKYSHDCDFYYRFWRMYSNPIILDEPTIINYLHNDSVTNTLVNQDLINDETKYIINKYDIKFMEK
jgi:glycosyltransferase involved in cell wall biosynthesis